MSGTTWLSVDPNEVVGLTRRLVAIPSITEAEGPEISEFVRSWLLERGLEAKLIPAGADRASVVCELGKGTPVLLFNAHLDTKPIEGMVIDPFKAEVRDGRLYGRGACDTKGAVAGMMLAAHALKSGGGPRRGCLRLVFEVGEEGRKWAAEQLWQEQWLQADFAVVGEPSDGKVQIGNRGRVGGLVRTFGKSTHTATAELGVNAIEKMCRIIQAFLDLPYRRFRDPIWGLAPLNFWKIESRGWEATVPYECVAYFDTRLPPHVRPEEVLAQMRAALAELQRKDPELRAEIPEDELWPLLPAAAISTDHKLVQDAREAYFEITGYPPALGANPAMTMAHILITRGVPAIIFGPGEIGKAHTADESVGLDELVLAARFYTALAERILG
ncbi:MAG: M20/M25/M40 family metallo-hydrolase [candidate division KSB1 bacterium]|nr:M20/M25/M40 family metallo-hydrolase [candidate division KSB1 bacterium]